MARLEILRACSTPKNHTASKCFLFRKHLQNAVLGGSIQAMLPQPSLNFIPPGTAVALRVFLLEELHLIESWPCF